MPCAAVVLLMAGAISVAPLDDCPAADAIADELGRLGALAALGQVGTAEVRRAEGQLHIAIRDHQGTVLGSRTVEAPAGCSARAALAAVLIAAWTGDWIRTNLGATLASPAVGTAGPEASAASAPPMPAPALAPSVRRVAPVATSPAARAPTLPPPPMPVADKPVLSPPGPRVPVLVERPSAPRASAPWHVDVAALGFGVHDGDAGTVGGGVEGILVRRWFLLVGLADGAAERQRPLGSGQAGYGFLRMGLGLGVRKAWQRAFVDVTLGPALVRHSFRGIALLQSYSGTSWGGEIDGRARLGWRFGRVAPFLCLGGSWSLLRERLWLDDATAPISLSRANLAAGLGISVAVH